MTSGSHPTGGAPFSAKTVRAVAAERDRPSHQLVELIRSLQAYAEEAESLGGVEGLVYEWRRSFDHDPVRQRTETAYYLTVEEAVWVDLGERIGLNDTERRDLQAVHTAQCRADLGWEPTLQALLLGRP